METSSVTTETIVPYASLESRLPDLQKQYHSADPFPHIVLDDFVNTEALEQGLKEFPSTRGKGWTHYHHVNENKFGKTKLDEFPPALRKIVEDLNSDRFVNFLRALTGYDKLFADESLEGGGLHQIGPGGYLNIHADYQSHPHHKDWRRRVNVLLYMNKNWQESYNGHLELWDKKMTNCLKKVLPIFNRAVIFNTSADSFHGHPSALTCPPGHSRKSIALYYFVKDSEPLLIGTTNYRARPQDGAKKILIQLDKGVLVAYDAVKRFFKMDDRLANFFLRFVSASRKKKAARERAKRLKRK